jgi:hypothetical protein
LDFGSVDLDNGFALGWLVTPDGVQHPFVMDKSLAEGNWPVGLARDVEHEQVGPLPVGWRREHGFRCLGFVANGRRRCGMAVNHLGGYCAHHAAQAQEADVVTGDPS